MTSPVAPLVALSCCACLAIAACGGSAHSGARAATARTPLAVPLVTLTAADRRVWAKLAPDRSSIPVLLYHGLGPKRDFSDAADADYGVNVADFAKQMTMIKHAGYRTIALQTFIDFVHGKHVRLPPRPLLLTFDDARADSWTGADGSSAGSASTRSCSSTSGASTPATRST